MMARAQRLVLSEASTAIDAFPQPKRVSLAESIADSIAEAIATRRLQSGERIVEMTLAERIGVSRVPIREALKVLHAQGILTGGAHRGYRVSAFGPQTIEKVVEVRLMLETFLLRDAIENWRNGSEDVAQFAIPIQQMEHAARAGDGGASLRADVEFHRAIRRAARNEIAGTLWDAIARHVLIIFNLERYRDSNLDAVPLHHKALRDFILAQIEKPGPIESLKDALEDHLLQVARSKRRVERPRNGKAAAGSR